MFCVWKFILLASGLLRRRLKAQNIYCWLVDLILTTAGSVSKAAQHEHVLYIINRTDKTIVFWTSSTKFSNMTKSYRNVFNLFPSATESCSKRLCCTISFLNFSCVSFKEVCASASLYVLMISRLPVNNVHDYESIISSSCDRFWTLLAVLPLFPLLHIFYPIVA